jgi:hypothetical protein
LNAYQNRRNEKARWRRFVRSLCWASKGTARSMVSTLMMMGALDKRNGGFGVPDNFAPRVPNRRKSRWAARMRRRG